MSIFFAELASAWDPNGDWGVFREENQDIVIDVKSNRIFDFFASSFLLGFQTSAASAMKYMGLKVRSSMEP